MGRRRERRLKMSADDVKNAYATISDKANSLTTATTIVEVNTANEARKRVRKTIRTFETSKARQKDRHTARLRTVRAWNKLGAAERRFIKERVKEDD
ncbi:hypothetical protein BGZ68_004264, partial [Mortierella alpina]